MRSAFIAKACCAVTMMIIFARPVDERSPLATTAIVKPAKLLRETPLKNLLPKLQTKKTSGQLSFAGNTDSLKGSNWYSTVMAEIERKSYFITTDGDSASSSNLQQSIHATYRANELTLSEMLKVDDLKTTGALPNKNDFPAKAGWQLQLTVDGLYSDSTCVSSESDVAGITTDTSVVNFVNPGMTTQYINTSEGVRQNFIVSAKPRDNTSDLRVKLHASENWVVNKVHDRELHFAQRNENGGLDNKVIYKDLNVWDAEGKQLAAKMELASGNHFDIVVAAAGAKYPITIDPLSATPTTILAGKATDSEFGHSLGTAGDVNGDGYSDVIIGAYRIASYTGAAYIYPGSPTGLSTTPLVTLAGTEQSKFGISVASAGDVNGDGYSDVIIGASGISSGKGAAYLFLGSSTGPSATPATILSGTDAGDAFGNSVASAGDVNGDGYSDVIVGAFMASAETGAAYVYLGASTGLSMTAASALDGNRYRRNTWVGTCVASAGDVNGDGYSDVIVGSLGPDISFTGLAFVYMGSSEGVSNTIATTLSGMQYGAYFAYSLSCAGDVNGDGYSDVIVGVLNEDAAYVYLGSLTGLSNIAASTLKGYVVAGAGDLNGDGYSDVMASRFDNSTNKNVVYVYSGSSVGISNLSANTLSTSANNSYYNNTLASAGDVNGDGYSDLLIGSTGVSSNTGEVYVFLGACATVSATPTMTLAGKATDSEFGHSLGTAGDVNGDGYSDVIIGAYRIASYTGAAYIYPGSPTGLSTTPLVTLAGTEQSKFGISVASAGDVNGDGYSDVIIGASGISSGKGAAYLFLGSSTGPSATPATILSGTDAGDAFGNSVASAGDVNGDGYSDVIVGAFMASAETGAAYVYLGASTGLSMTAASALDGNRYRRNTWVGTCVASAGDVNGDGYSDVIVGSLGPDISFTGLAFVYMGSSEGVSNTIATTLSGMQYGAYFAYSLSCAGDVNGDGYSDVIVGVLNEDAAYVYLGSLTGLSNIAASTLKGYVVAGAGDLNGDGYSDVMASRFDNSTNKNVVYVYSGSSVGISNLSANTLSTSANNSYYNNTLASAGDVNGDGYSDLLIGSTGVSSNTGEVYVFLGACATVSATPTMTLAGKATDSEFGHSLGTAGDVNGDGYSDVIIGAYRIASYTGAAYIYPGSPTGLSTTPLVTLAGTEQSKFGISVASAGDVNGDGYSDVIIGASGISSGKGAAYLFLGSSTGPSATPATILSGTDAGDAFGNSVASAGDVNGDGYSDVIVGAFMASAETGAAYVYLGASTGLSMTAASALDGNRYRRNTWVGTCVASAGDVNGDGYSDVIVGSLGPDISFTGLAFVYMGSSEGVSNTIATTLSGMQYGAYFAYSLSCAGDVNGDGYSDVIVGVLNEDAAYVYLGSLTGLSNIAASTLKGYVVAGAGDLNGDGYSDVMASRFDNSTNKNVVYVYSGSSVGISNLAIHILNTSANNSYYNNTLASAGDVNGDGYSDLLIGSTGVSSNTGEVYVYLASIAWDNTLRLYNSNLTAPLNQSNRSDSQFGAGLFVPSVSNSTKARLVWETEKQGVGFSDDGPISKYTDYVTIAPGGVELKALIAKTGAATKFRVRVQYEYPPSIAPSEQEFGQWIYPQNYLIGLQPGILWGRAGQPLPVGLLSFSASKEAPGLNRLTWTTSDEMDFDRFEIQRSADARSFESIGMVRSLSEQVDGVSILKTYTFTDRNTSPTCYYRLKMIDMDASFKYSRVISIANAPEKSVVGPFYPNPSKGHVLVDVYSVENANWTITTHNVNGKIMHSEVRSLQKGLNKITFEKNVQGVNLVHFSAGEFSEVRKLIVK